MCICPRNVCKKSHLPITNSNACWYCTRMQTWPHIWQTCKYCAHVYLLWGKSTCGFIIWSHKAIGLIFNSAWKPVCQPLDCLNHIILPPCILMNDHQAKRCSLSLCAYVSAAKVHEEPLYVPTRACARLASTVHGYLRSCERSDTHGCFPWHDLNLH